MLRFFRRLSYWIHHRRESAELREEMEIHRAMARDPRALGNTALAHEDARAVWIWPWLEGVLQDLRHATRQWRQTPAFTLIVVLSLALGIGASTVVFSVVDTLLVRRLPGVGNAEELVLVEMGEIGVVNRPFFEALEAEDVIADAFVWDGPIDRWMSLPGQDPASGVPIAVQTVSRGMFATLNVSVVEGRGFLEEDEQPGAPAVGVVSHEFWRKQFGSDSGVTGRTILVAGEPLTIVGIAPRGFRGPGPATRPDLWQLAEPEDGPVPPFALNFFNLRMMARPRAGATIGEVEAAAEVVRDALVEQGMAERGVRVRSGATGYSALRGQYGQPLGVLAAAVAAVLLIACANAGGMLLARGQARRREFAVRLALGGGRLRLLRQLLTENALPGLAGGGIGVTAAFAGTRLASTSPLVTSELADLATGIGPDPRTLGFAILCTALSVLLSGLAPAILLTRLDPDTVTRGRAAHSAPRTPAAAHRFLVTVQIALALALVVGSGLLLGTLANLERVDTGFRRESTMLFSVQRAVWARGPSVSFTPGDAESRALQERFAVLPGVVFVARMQGAGVLLGGTQTTRVRPDDASATDEGIECFTMYVGAGFFRTMGIALLGGREFRPEEEGLIRSGRRPAEVAIVNETLARELFGERGGVGRRVDGRTVVGVVDDSKYLSLREAPRCTLYRPTSGSVSSFVLSFEGRATPMKQAIVSTVEALDPTLEAAELRTVGEVIEATTVRERLVSRLTSAFAVIALLLAAIGIYGTLSYAVARRTREIGVRMALGARVMDVVRLFLTEAGWMVGAGVVVGCAVALATTRLLASLLFGLSPTDPGTFAMAVLVLAGTAALAAWLPTRRAARVAPAVALRHE